MPQSQKGRETMNRFDTMSKDALSRVEEIMNSTKLNEFLHRKEEEEKKKTCILWVLAIIGAVAAVAAIAYGVSSLRTIWRISRMTLTMILTMISSKKRKKTQINKTRQRVSERGHAF